MKILTLCADSNENFDYAILTITPELLNTLLAARSSLRALQVTTELSEAVMLILTCDDANIQYIDGDDLGIVGESEGDAKDLLTAEQRNSFCKDNFLILDDDFKPHKAAKSGDLDLSDLSSRLVVNERSFWYETMDEYEGGQITSDPLKFDDLVGRVL
jgi:hypothetical protein